MNNITVAVKDVYGNKTIYPLCDKAKTFCSLLGQKTLTFNNITWIKQLGYEIKQQQDAIIL